MRVRLRLTVVVVGAEVVLWDWLRRVGWEQVRLRLLVVVRLVLMVLEVGFLWKLECSE